MEMKDYSGLKIGTLLVESFEKRVTGATKRSRIYWKCLCDCGNETFIDASRLNSAKSCGCLQGERHGKSYTKIYRVWRGVIERCYDPKNKNFKTYGAAGVTVCDAWRNSFESFFNDMGDRPTEKHSLDRIENSKGYCKDNCRWATPKEQANNKTNNVILEFEGISKTLSQWADTTSIPLEVLRCRINKHKWPIKKALTTPNNEYITLIELDGKALSLPQWSKEKGLPYKTVFARISERGWPIEKALNTPVRAINRNTI